MNEFVSLIIVYLYLFINNLILIFDQTCFVYEKLVNKKFFLLKPAVISTTELIAGGYQLTANLHIRNLDGSKPLLPNQIPYYL